MPLPFILAAVAGAAIGTGIGSGIAGGIKMKEANDTMDLAKSKQNKAIRRFENHNSETTNTMDLLGKKELEILKDFEEFSNIFEKIQNRPEFDNYNKSGIDLPKYNEKELKETSVGAGVLLGGLGGAAVGTAGAFAASGATTAAVMALGTASTGTAISTLSGVAATNATLAVLGGGTIAAGGGGVALGSALLGGATLGVGLLVGGMIFEATGKRLSEQADEAYEQACRTEEEVDEIVDYLDELKDAAEKFKKGLTKVENKYKEKLSSLNYTVNVLGKRNWDDFTYEEKEVTENTVLLVGLLYKMCKVELVEKDYNDRNRVNQYDINEAIDEADDILMDIA